MEMALYHIIKKTWCISKQESEFPQLFNKVKACENSNFDNDFYDEVLNFKNELEQQCNTETPENAVTNNNDILNSHILSLMKYRLHV